MSPPSVNLDTTFERFLQELPVDYWPLAIEFKVFCRARRIKSPAQLLQVVLCYCGIEGKDKKFNGRCRQLGRE